MLYNQFHLMSKIKIMLNCFIIFLLIFQTKNVFIYNFFRKLIKVYNYYGFIVFKADKQCTIEKFLFYFGKISIK